MPPTPGLRGQGTSPGIPAGFLVSSGWVNALLSSPPILGGPLLPASLDLPSLPPMPPGPMWLEREVEGLEGMGTCLGAQQAPGPEWVGQSPSTPLPLLPDGSSCLPLLISLASFLCPQGPTRPARGFGGQGIGLGAQQAPGPEWAGQSLSTPLLLLPDGSSCLPLLISPASLLCPRTHAAWMGLWRGGTSLEAQQAPWPEWARQLPSTPLPLFPESSTRLPLLTSLASGSQILSALHFSSPLSPPTSYWFTLVFLPSPWVSESPTSGRQAP